MVVRDSDNDPVGSRVASNVRWRRAQAGLTLEQLSVALDNVGWPISAAALLRIEQHKRGVEAGDLAAIAALLGVTVVDLLAPVPDEAFRPIKPTPGTTCTHEEYHQLLARPWSDQSAHLSRTASDSAPATDTASATVMLAERAAELERLVHNYMDEMLAQGITNSSPITVEREDGGTLTIAPGALSFGTVAKADVAQATGTAYDASVRTEES